MTDAAAEFNGLVEDLDYPMYVVTAAMVADSSHVGTAIIAALIVFMSGILSAVLGAAVLAISEPSDVAVALLSVFIVLPMVISLRFGKHPK